MADTAEAHEGPDDRGENRSPDTQPDRGEESLYEDIGYPALTVRVIAKKKLWDGSPIPFVMETYVDPVYHVGAKH
jgi:hypothetical protein